MSILSEQFALTGVLADVAQAVDYARVQHPDVPDDIGRQIAILTEELGEAAKEALDGTRSNRRDIVMVPRAGSNAALGRYYEELAQLAGESMRIMAHLAGMIGA